MDKAALLDAIARSGSAGQAAYDQAQAAIAQQQADAVRMALSSGIAGNAPTGAQAELQQIISQPYQSRSAQITQNQANMKDWYSRLAASQGAWADQQNALQSIALEQALAKATGGSGGGSGGSGGSSTDSWDKQLKDAFGTLDIAKASLPNEANAANATDWHTTGVEPTQGVRDYASFVYGVPASTSAAWFPQPQFASDVNGLLATVHNRKTARTAAANLRKAAPDYAGQNTGYYVKAARKQLGSQYPQAAKQGWRKPNKYAKKGK